MNSSTDPRQRSREDLREMPFFTHLEDLRRVIIHSLIVVGVLTVACWFVSGKILDLLLTNLPVESLYFTSPVEAFMTRLKVSLVLGIMVGFPFVLFKVWSFVSPGLFKHERSKTYPFVLSSSLLFYAGFLFCYLILIPFVLRFLLGFGTDLLNPLLTVNSYFAFVARLCFTFGIVFQLPVVVLLLSALGIVKPRWLLKQWRYAIIVIFVASAILTPPDAISLMLMALPVLILYIASVLIAFVVVRRKDARSEEDEEET